MVAAYMQAFAACLRLEALLEPAVSARNRGTAEMGVVIASRLTRPPRKKD
jgi:hypothetical protein